MPKKRIRIKDIAEAAGVSTGTVDRVLHNRGNVLPEVKQRVEAVMQELNYQPNILARTLANNKLLTIATLLPHYHTDIFWEAPWKGIEKALAVNLHYGLEVKHYFFDELDVKTFENQSNKLLEMLPDALIVAPIFAKEATAFLTKFTTKNIPIVLINTNLPTTERLCYIGQDSYQCGVLAGKLISTRQPANATFLLLNLEVEEKADNAAHIIQKEEGFNAYFENTAPAFTIIKQSFSDAKKGTSLKVFLQKMIATFPNLNGIFVTTSKAYQLVEILGNQLDHVTIIGFDLLPKNIEWLKAGKIDYLINQNPEKQGFLAITNLIDFLLLKKEITAVQYLPLDIVVKENVDYYI